MFDAPRLQQERGISFGYFLNILLGKFGSEGRTMRFGNVLFATFATHPIFAEMIDEI